MKLSYRTDYWDSPALKVEFNRFLKRIHNLDLLLWDKMGFWDHRYRPFSYFDGDTMVSNVCVYSLNMVVDGKPCRVAQVSAVGTLGEYRRKGLSLELNQKATEWARAEHDFFYLFADEEARQLYRKCGFHAVDEHKTRISVTGDAARPGAMKLDIDNADHLAQIYRMASRREPVSNLLGILNEKLFMFWCLYFLSDNIYYIPDLDILMLYEREDGLVTVSDIVGARVPAFSDIYPYISSERDEAVEFLFVTDRMNLDSGKQVKARSNGTHVMGDFPFEDTGFIFPRTSQA